MRFTGTIDDPSLTGRVAIESFDTQALRVTLKGDRLDLDRYLAPPTEEEKAQQAARDSQAKQNQAAIAGAGLSLGRVDEVFHETVPAGQVAGQDPAAGTEAARGTAVNLSVSKGPEDGTAAGAAARSPT